MEFKFTVVNDIIITNIYEYLIQADVYIFREASSSGLPHV